MRSYEEGGPSQMAKWVIISYIVLVLAVALMATLARARDENRKAAADHKTQECAAAQHGNDPNWSGQLLAVEEACR